MEDIMATQSVTYTKAGANFTTLADAYTALTAAASGILADVMSQATVTNSSFTATSLSETRSWNDAAWNAYRARDLASAKATLEANGWSVSEIVS